MLRGTSYVGQNFLPKTIGGKTVLNNNHKMKGHSFRMAPNKARRAYIEGSEKPTNAEIQSMCLTGGRGAMRQMQGRVQVSSLYAMLFSADALNIAGTRYKNANGSLKGVSST